MDYLRGRLKRLKPRNWSKEPNRSPPNAPPALPDVRPRPLTATTSDATATAESSFFQLLPSELRRRVLIEAFGARTLHLDLRLEHPLKKNSKPGTSHSRGHANAQLFHPSLRDSAQRREWTWWSCVCHQWIPCGDLNRDPPGLEVPFTEPTLDRCRDPSGLPRCESYPGELPEKCSIGAMGWLLVCRQAYIEGVDVLYSTNRFHIAYAELAVYLPRFLLPQRLAAMKDVELIWSRDIEFSAHFNMAVSERGSSQLSDRLSILTYLPQVLPNLRYLYLSLKDILNGKNWRNRELFGSEMYEVTEEVVRFIDTVVLRMSQLRECRVALSLTLFGTRKSIESGQAFKRYNRTGQPDALWRDISNSNAYPKLAADRPGVGGYWIVRGHDDMGAPTIFDCMESP